MVDWSGSFENILIICLKVQGKVDMAPLIKTELALLIINEPCYSMQIITIHTFQESHHPGDYVFTLSAY